MIPALALLLTAETALFTLAGFLYLRSLGRTIAESGAGAVLMVFMGVSLIHQVDLWVGSPWPGLVGELIVLVAIGAVGWRRRPQLVGWFRSAANLIRQEMVPGISLTLAWVMMAILVMAGWAPPSGAPWEVVLAGFTQAPPPLLTATHPIAPLNATALFYHATRFGLAPEACGFGLLAHMAVGLATYGLARRYAWPPMALTITLMVLSMPRLVWLALHPSAELISTVALAVSVLVLYRLVEQHRVGDLHLFLLGLAFSIYGHPMSAALVLVMILLLVVVMTRRHGWLSSRHLMVDRPMPTVLVLLLAVMLAQVPTFTFNLIHGHPLFGMAIDFDTGGIIGAGANLVRYLFISVDPTEAVQSALAWLIGLDLKQSMMGLYQPMVVTLFGPSGASAPFVPFFSGSDAAGVGPFAALLVLPAMIYAALRGPRRIRALSVAWAGYLYLAALVMAWSTDNIVVLTPFYAANGFMVAFALPPWRLRRRGMRLLQVLFMLLLAGTLSQG